MSNFVKFNFKLIQWNARSLMLRFQDLEKHSLSYDCFAISETWLLQSQIFLLKGFDIIRQDRVGRRGGGVALLINHKFRYKEIAVQENCNGKLEVCAAEIIFHGESLFLISCYRPPNSGRISVEEWLRFFTQFNPQRGIIFAGNFNAHNIQWGSASTCPIGDNLWSAIADSDFDLLGNEVPISTFCGNSIHGLSIIDLTICHSSILLKFHREIFQDSWGSDHFPNLIQSYVQYKIPDYAYQRRRLYSKSTNWNVFKEVINNDLRNFFDLAQHLNVQGWYTNFVAIMESTSFSPQRKINRSPSCPWWSSECDVFITQRRDALNRFKLTGTRDDYVKYRIQCGVTRKALRNIKQEAFKHFAESINKDTCPNLIWDTVKRFDSRWNSTAKDHSWSEVKRDIIQSQIDDLFPPWVLQSPPDLSSPGIDVFLDQPFF